jgi:hypothetical protein
MLCEFTRELACILWIGTEVQTANRTFVLTTPTASAITNYHDGPQAHFLDCHADSVRLQLTDEKRLGDLRSRDLGNWPESHFPKMPFLRLDPEGLVSFERRGPLFSHFKWLSRTSAVDHHRARTTWRRVSALRSANSLLPGVRVVRNRNRRARDHQRSNRLAHRTCP